MTSAEAVNRLKSDIYEYADFQDNPNEDEFWEAFDMAIKALEQEPCEDWHDIPSNEMNLEQARQAVRDLRKFVMDNHILPKLQSCKDAISRQAVLEQINCWIGSGEYRYTNATHYLTRRMQDLPSVTPQPKTGHWIKWYEQKEDDWVVENIPHCKCSECGKEYDPHLSQFIKYCNKCGAKMVEPQAESEKKCE